jgi:hypothetical protein
MTGALMRNRFRMFRFVYPLGIVVKCFLEMPAIQTVGGGRKAGGRRERRDEGNSTLEWGVLRRVAAVS